MRTIYLDTETTGLRPHDSEIVELALLDEHGDPILDTLLRPRRLTRWEEAQAIHGITPAMVADAPTLEDITPALLRALSGARLIIYNAAYDLAFLEDALVHAPSETHCCMERFAEFFGDWNSYRGNYRWQKLTTAADHVGHLWTGKAHRAAADALACRSVWRFLELDEPAREAHLRMVRARRLVASTGM